VSKKTKITLGVLVILAALGYLMVSGFSQFSAYYLTIEEVLAKGDSIYGDPLRVSGKVIGDSVQWDPEKVLLKFKVQENGKTLSVVHNGVRPDNFDDGQGVILEGTLREDGVFQADSILVQCPSKYEAMEEGNDSG